MNKLFPYIVLLVIIVSCSKKHTPSALTSPPVDSIVENSFVPYTDSFSGRCRISIENDYVMNGTASETCTMYVNHTSAVRAVVNGNMLTRGGTVQRLYFYPVTDTAGTGTLYSWDPGTEVYDTVLLQADSLYVKICTPEAYFTLVTQTFAGRKNK